MFDNIYPNHHYSTRQREQPVVARGKTKVFINSIRFSLPQEISNTQKLILDKLDTHSLIGFSNYAKNCFINRYKLTCSINNCYICNRVYS